MDTQARINSRGLSFKDRRALIFHILYSMDSFDYQVSCESVIENLDKGFDIDLMTDYDLIKDIKSIINNINSINDLLMKSLDNWKIDRLSVATRLILYLAVWEILNTNLDNILIINEAIELCKSFAEKDAYKLVNGVLDVIIKSNIKEPNQQTVTC